jgi:hypothetical protein
MRQLQERIKAMKKRTISFALAFTLFLTLFLTALPIADLRASASSDVETLRVSIENQYNVSIEFDFYEGSMSASAQMEHLRRINESLATIPAGLHRAVASHLEEFTITITYVARHVNFWRGILLGTAGFASGGQGSGAYAGINMLTRGNVNDSIGYMSPLIFYHEYGHVLAYLLDHITWERHWASDWATRGTPLDIRDEWNALNRAAVFNETTYRFNYDPAVFVSRNATFDEDEDIAETFAHFTATPVATFNRTRNTVVLEKAMLLERLAITILGVDRIYANSIIPRPLPPISVIHNGSPLSFDVPPQTIGDRTMVPMRAIFDALGAEVRWNGTTQTITATKGETVIVLRLGNNMATINGVATPLDQPAVAIDGRTLVPLRFVGDALGAGVRWDGEARTVTITS